MSQLIDRRSLLGLTAGGIALATVGCTPGGGANPPSVTPTSAGPASSPSAAAALKVNWYGPPPVTEAMGKALDAFGAANPNVTTTGTGVVFGDFWDKLATQVAGGDTPDVMRMSMTYFTDYASRGVLRDLAPDLGQTIDASQVDAAVRDSGLFGDKLMGLGQSSIAPALFTHSGVLEAAGTTVPTDWSWDDFVAWAKDFAKSTGKWGTTDIGGNWQMFDVYARQQVGNQFDDNGQLLVTEAVAESWFAMWDDLRKAKAAPPQDVSTAAGGDWAQNPVAKGEAAITAGWVQQVNFLQPLITDANVGVTALPQAVKGDLSGLFVKALDFWVVSATTEHPEAATALVDFLVNDPAATTELGMLLGVPPTAAARQKLVGSAPAVDAAIAYLDAITPKVGPGAPPWPRGYGDVMSAWVRASESVGFGQATPGEAATAFVAEAKAALA